MQFFKVQATKAFCLSRQCFNAGMDLKFFQTVTTIYSRFFCSVNRDLLPFSYHSTLSIVKLCQRSMQFDFLVTVIVAQSFFVVLACHSLVLDGFVWHFPASVHTLSSAVNKSRWLRNSKNFRECGETNPGLLGEKLEHYLCAMQPPCRTIFVPW